MCDTLLTAGALPATAALLKRSIESYPASEGNKTLREHILSTLGNAINLLWLLWYVNVRYIHIRRVSHDVFDFQPVVIRHLLSHATSVRRCVLQH